MSISVVTQPRQESFGECETPLFVHRIGASAQCYGYYDDDDKGLKEYDKASKVP